MTSQDSKTANTLLVFDAQLISLTSKTLQKLRSSLLSTSKCGWIIDVVAGLPAFWKMASATIPKLQDDKVSVLLEDLDAWVQQGSFAHASLPFPNVLLTPITVIVELLQFVNYLEKEGLAWEDLSQTHETSGFCTGLLSAFAVSSSASAEDFKKHGAAAIRLGLLVGAVVDHQNQGGNRSSDWTSTSVGWSSQEQKTHLDKVVDRTVEVSYASRFSLSAASCSCELSTNAKSFRRTLLSRSMRIASLSPRAVRQWRASSKISHGLDSASSRWTSMAAFTVALIVTMSSSW